MGVTAIPFGVQITAPPDGLPTVQKVEKNFEAHKRGVLVGDVLVEVAGMSVDSSSWFRLYSQASPPFGLKFRRRVFMKQAMNKTGLGAAVALQNIFFRNQYRQSWNATLRKKAIAIAKRLRQKGPEAIKNFFKKEEESEDEDEDKQATD